MSRFWSIAAGTVGVAAVAGLLAATDAIASSPLLARGRVEQPRFEVVETHDGFEVRRYAPRLVAEVEVDGDPRKATNAGFRILADFIFGNNAAAESVAMTSPVERRGASEKIAMTAPVDRRVAGERWVITFTMPSEYTAQTLPQPKDRRIKIRELPAERFAAFTFSGSPGESKVVARIADARKAVAEAGLEAADREAIYSRYDPPWTPSFMRRNEILIPLVSPAPAP